MIKQIKQEYKNIPIVVGGSQVSAAPGDVIEDLGADFGVIGEGEITLLELVRVIENRNHRNKSLGAVDGLVYRNSRGNIIINKPRALIENLDSIPFPAWDLMPPNKYRIVPILEPAKALPIAPVITTRGCPYHCSFCASNVTWLGKIRYRSVENILKEITLLKNHYGVNEIHISDDNFTMDTGRAERVCDALIEHRVRLPWQCPNGVRVDRLTLPLIKKMKKAGCYAVGLGIESGNQEVLNKVSKHLNLSIVPEVLQNLHRVGIESYGFFILGLPGETRKSIEDTIKFSLTHPFDRAWFNIFTPYPGSEAFTEWIGKRKFTRINWNKHDCSNAIVALSDVSKRKLEKLQKKALARFYLRPKILVNLVKRIGIRELTTLLMSRFFRTIAAPISDTTHTLLRRG